MMGTMFSCQKNEIDIVNTKWKCTDIDLTRFGIVERIYFNENNIGTKELYVPASLSENGNEYTSSSSFSYTFDYPKGTITTIADGEESITFSFVIDGDDNESLTLKWEKEYADKHFSRED